MALSNVTNAISGIATTATGISSKLGALTSDNTNNDEIRDRYLNGFLAENSRFTPSVFPRMFDEPTYLTFRIEFVFDPELPENAANYHSQNAYNMMTCPLLASTVLFSKLGNDENKFINIKTGNNNIPWMQGYIDSNDVSTGVDTHFYSTEKYLHYALGEKKRSILLREFIKALHDIQVNYPYYFTEVSGLNSLSTINTSRGMRLSDDNNTITIKCIEGLDLKITQLMQMYRKIVWDDVYQRWILPDMMRFFNVNIYVSEMRLFHSKSVKSSNKNVGRVVDFSTSNMNATSYDQLSDNSKSFLNTANSILNAATGMASSILGPNNAVSKIVEGANAVTDTISTVKSALSGNAHLCNSAINDVMPTIKYECKMCEFIIDDTLGHIGSLSSSRENNSSPTPEIKFKVGKLNEVMLFPLDRDNMSIVNNKYVPWVNKQEKNYMNDIDTTGMSELTAKVLKSLAGGTNESVVRIQLGDTTVNVQNKLLNDDSLQLEATWRNESNGFYNVIPSKISQRMNRMNPIFGGNTESITTDYTQNSSKDGTTSASAESYDPFSPSKATAVTTLAGGLLGAVATNRNSEAINGDYANSVREHKNIDNFISKQTYGTAANSDATSHSNLRNTNVVGDSIAYTIGTSTATSGTIKSLEKTIDETSAESVLAAAESIRNVLSYVDNSEMVKSTATDETTVNNIKNQLLREVVESLAKSTATDSNSAAVQKLANIILEDNVLQKSTATNPSQADRDKAKSAFEMLN